MFIHEIEIKDNTRLALRGITHLTIDFNDVHQLILGTNGCGKSTLMQELSPMPATGNDYFKNGFKRILIEHNSKMYQLKSVFTKSSGEHSFVDLQTNEELNQGGTQSVQKELVREIFNFDSSLHELLTDQIKFTNMSPMVRRDWLTRISGTNLDMAIDVFNKIKRVQRDEEGVLKHLNNRLNKESGDVYSQSQIDNMLCQIQDLDVSLKEMYNNRINKHLPIPIEQNIALRQSIKKSTEIAGKLLRIDFDKVVDSVGDIDQFKEMRIQLATQAKSLIEQNEKLHEEYQEITNVVSEVETINSKEQVEEITNRVKFIYQTIDDLKTRLVRIAICNNPIEVYGRVSGISDNLKEIIGNLIDNTDGIYTREKIDSSKQELEKINNQLTSCLSRIRKLEHDINHIKRTDEFECPECKNVFKPGVSIDDLPKLSKLLEDENALEAKLSKDKEDIVKYLDSSVDYINNYRKLTNTIKQYGDLQDYIGDIANYDLRTNHPNVLITHLDEVIGDLKILSDIAVYEPELIKLEATIDKINNFNENGKYTKSKLEQIMSTIKSNQLVISNNRKLYDEMTKQLSNYEKIMTEYDIFVDSLKVVNDEVIKMYESEMKRTIDSTITHLNTNMGHLNIELRTALNKREIIDDIEKSREESISKNELLKILISEINPTTGIIADFFRQFINQFVEQMNIVINKVWNHPIEILPCGIDDSGLTYKFPLRVNDKEHGPPDVSKGSNSQVTITNFAFKIVVMIYLGLENYPLWLDELAPDLDEKHRVNIINFVRDFVESKRCSQMFMVSHYESGYGVFTNAQFLVLDEENLLELPSSYNKHATITRAET